MSIVKLLNSANQTVNGNNLTIAGVVVGIVEDIKDPEGLGRVRVNFPWLADKPDTVTIKKGERAHSYWARIATMMAGGKRGSFFIPEVDDEVLVAFEHGRQDRPFVIGMLWNKKAAPPEQMDADGKNDLRAIHTRSGHKVIFNDSKDKPSIKIVDKTGDNFIEIDSTDNAMTIKVKGDLTIDAGGKISIKAGADIAIEAGAGLTVKAGAAGTIQTAQKLTAKSDLGVTIDGSVSTEVKGATVKVQGSAMTEIQGGLVKIN